MGEGEVQLNSYVFCNYSGGCWEFAQPPTVTAQMCSRFVHLEIRSVLVLLEKL